MRNPVLWLGLAIVLSYWLWVRPPGPFPGYSEDMCYADMSRQLMSQEIRDHGHPVFTTDRFMTPFGASIPYMSWGVERDWLGAKFWDLDRDFPFIWASFGASMLIAYLGVGLILIRMGRRNGMSPGVAWALSALVVVFHVPRHFKIWHHQEHLMQHWVYLSLFLDAWIWQEAWRGRRWSLSREAWRGFMMVGMLGTVGYFWGPLIIEWTVVRVGLAILVARAWRRKELRLGRATGGEEPASEFRIEWSPLGLGVPLVVTAGLLGLYLRWFLPLSHEVGKLGEVWSGLAWFAKIQFWVRPLWLDPFVPNGFLAPIDTPETLVTIGWIYWVPALLALWVIRKRRGGTGAGVLAPFLLVIATGILYASWGGPPNPFQWFIQTFVPFMGFFRVAARWGLFMPELFGIVVVLAWPELRAWIARRRAGPHAAWHFGLLIIFGALSLVEFRWLLYPVNDMPELPKPVERMLTTIRDLPGSAVLNLPFCVVGGNGYCTEQQCPNYPYSTMGECLRLWHDKKVYGLYQARMTPSHCAIYDRPPFQSWFSAWKEQRCFTDPEWDDFCGYLDQHRELSAILLTPEIWYGAGQPACMRKFEEHLGAPLGEGILPISPTRGGKGANPVRILWFQPVCRPAHKG